MKKIIAMLLAVVMVFALCACGSQPAADNTPAEESKAPAEETPAASSAEGSVYYLNFKPEADEAWQKVAAAYTEQTGVPVKVVTAASGTYQETLTAEMDKSEAPTMFQVGNQGAVDTWGEYCYDLTNTDVWNEMTTHAFDLTNEDGFTYSIGYCYECFGIIVNKALLEKAGHSIDEINNFDSLKAVADDIHARAAELGFDAFSSAGLDGSSSWRFSGHLAICLSSTSSAMTTCILSPPPSPALTLTTSRLSGISTSPIPLPPALTSSPPPATLPRQSSATARPYSIRTAPGSTPHSPRSTA